MSVKPVILMIDDDQVDVFSMRRALSKAGYSGEFNSISSGQKFLDARTKLKPTPDLILMDMNMPGVDGFKVIEVMKADQAWKSVPVLVMTTSDLITDKLRSAEVGAQAFITKPSGRKEMNAVLEQIGKYVNIAA